MTERCFECDGNAVLMRGSRKVNVGRRTVTVDVEYMRCQSCGETYYLPGQMREMQRAAADVARRYEGLLAPSEIAEIRQSYGFSQAEMESLINAGPKTITRWERGTVCQNGTADTLLRILRDYPAVVANLAARRGVVPLEIRVQQLRGGARMYSAFVPRATHLRPSRVRLAEDPFVVPRGSDLRQLVDDLSAAAAAPRYPQLKQTGPSWSHKGNASDC